MFRNSATFFAGWAFRAGEAHTLLDDQACARGMNILSKCVTLAVMKQADIVKAFSALGQPKRLEAFKLLLQREPEGVHAGELARILNAPFNTMSAHLAILARAGLVNTVKSGRFITYRVDAGAFARIVTNLLKDCCDARPDLYAPVFEEFNAMISKPETKSGGC